LLTVSSVDSMGLAAVIVTFADATIKDDPG
jgi:hypothetical protein